MTTDRIVPRRQLGHRQQGAGRLADQGSATGPPTPPPRLFLVALSLAAKRQPGRLFGMQGGAAKQRAQPAKILDQARHRFVSLDRVRLGPLVHFAWSMIRCHVRLS